MATMIVGNREIGQYDQQLLVQTLQQQEVPIYGTWATAPTFVTSQAEPPNNTWMWVAAGIVGAVAITAGLYYASKKSNKRRR